MKRNKFQDPDNVNYAFISDDLMKYGISNPESASYKKDASTRFGR